MRAQPLNGSTHSSNRKAAAPRLRTCHRVDGLGPAGGGDGLHRLPRCEALMRLQRSALQGGQPQGCGRLQQGGVQKWASAAKSLPRA